MNSDALVVRLQAHGFVTPARPQAKISISWSASINPWARLMNEESGTDQGLVTVDWRTYMRCHDGCGKIAPCNRKPPSDELVNREDTKEAALQALMIAGLKGDAAAYRVLLSELSGHLRAYYRSKLVRAGRGTEETWPLSSGRSERRRPRICLGQAPWPRTELLHRRVQSEA